MVKKLSSTEKPHLPPMMVLASIWLGRSLARLGMFRSANDAKSRFIHKVRAVYNHRPGFLQCVRLKSGIDYIGLMW